MTLHINIQKEVLLELDNRKSRIPNDFPKEKYQKLMAGNLVTLRARLKLNQEELAELIGCSRYMISLIERGVRPMMWDTFMTLLFLFRSNVDTREMMPFLGLYTPELLQYLNVTDLGHFKQNKNETEE